MRKPTNANWLSRSGEVHGPYDDDALARLMLTPEYATFAWIWERKARKWRPTHALPPPPPDAALSPPELAAAATKIQALVHDRQNLVSGALCEVSDAGFTLETRSAAAELPQLKCNNLVWVELLCEESGSAETLRARVTEVRRSAAGRWQYRLAWSAMPDLLIQAA
jgi:hypothetical protein